MALTHDQITEVGKEQFGNNFHLSPTCAQFARAIEGAATAPLLERIAELEAKLEQQAEAQLVACQGKNCKAHSHANSPDHSPECVLEAAECQGWLDSPEADEARRALAEIVEPSPVAWVNKDHTYVALATKSTVYGSHTIPLYTSPPKAVPLTDEQQAILSFLGGSGPLDGVWYGDKHPTERGMYWWRKRMWSAFGAPATGEKEGE